MLSKNGLSIVVTIVVAVFQYFNIDVTDNMVLEFYGHVLQAIAILGLVWHQIAERPEIKGFIFKRWG